MFLAAVIIDAGIINFIVYNGATVIKKMNPKTGN
jgi:hypothetical protein